METKVLIALIIVVLLVVGVNGLLIVAMRKGRDIEQIRLWQKAFRRARNPWDREEKDLQELSRLVAQLKVDQLKVAQLKKDGEKEGEEG